MQDIELLFNDILRHPGLGSNLSVADQGAIERYVEERWKGADKESAEDFCKLMSVVPSLNWLQFLRKPRSPSRPNGDAQLVLAKHEEAIRASIAEVLAADGSNA